MEVYTMEHRLMTEHEKVEIATRSMKLWEEGKEEESRALDRTIPLSPYLAKYWRKMMGKDFLINSGWNLAEALEEYGQDWLDTPDEVSPIAYFLNKNK
jgi:hypothetical protein